MEKASMHPITQDPPGPQDTGSMKHCVQSQPSMDTKSSDSKVEKTWVQDPALPGIPHIFLDKWPEPSASQVPLYDMKMLVGSYFIGL